MLDLGFRLEDQELQRLRRNAATVGPALGQAMTKVRLRIVERIMKSKLEGQVLRHVTGALSRSIAEGGAAQTGQTGPLSARAVVGTKLPYGRFWELGGTIPAREIYPRNKAALFWPGAAHPVKHVHQDARTVAARPFIHPSVEESKGDIREILSAMIRAQLLGGNA